MESVFSRVAMRSGGLQLVTWVGIGGVSITRFEVLASLMTDSDLILRRSDDAGMEDVSTRPKIADAL